MVQTPQHRAVRCPTLNTRLAPPLPSVRVLGGDRKSISGVPNSWCASSRQILTSLLCTRAQREAGDSSIPVKLSTIHRVQFGEVVKVVGEAEELGAWSPAAAPVMVWSGGDSWTLHLRLAPATWHAFKCVVAHMDGTFDWEAGDNRYLNVSLQPGAANAGTLEVFCPWNNTAGTTLERAGERLQLAVSEVPVPNRVYSKGLNTAPIFRQIYILFPAPQAEKRFIGIKYQDKTREQLGSSLKPMGIIGLVAEADWPTDALAQDEDLLNSVNIQSLDDVTLEDRGRFVVIYGRPDFADQLREIAGWRDSWVEGFENEMKERLVMHLIELGHADVQAYCGPKKMRKPGSNAVLGEIDAAALADDCAIIAEVKTTLNDEAVTQLIRSLDVMGDMVDEGAPLASPFQGKRLLGALGGRIITSHEPSKRSLVKQASRNHFKIFLPNGQGISHGDSCTSSPSSPSCSATRGCMLTCSKPAERWLPSWTRAQQRSRNRSPNATLGKIVLPMRYAACSI